MPTTSDTEWAALGDFASVCVRHKDKTWQRQAAPYTKPLPYNMYVGVNKGNGPWSDPRNNSFLGDIQTYGSTHIAAAVNTALDRLAAAARGAKGAGIGIQATKIKQSFAMISGRAGQLVDAASALKSGNLGRFLNIFGLTARRNHKRYVKKRDGSTTHYTPKGKIGEKRYVENITFSHVSKNASGFWLEYNFGWKNFFNTIYESIQVCQAAWPDVTIKGRKSVGFGMELPYNGSEFTTRAVGCTIRCHLQAEMRITNPNLLLAESLGLVNPAHVFWDWLPFSYMVDWLANVGKWLKSWTNFAGVELSDSQTTMSYTGSWTGVSMYQWNGQPRLADINFFAMTRTLGLPSYRFIFDNPLQSFSGWNASIVFANLVGILSSLKGKS